jgi:hypothetical protein
MPPTGWLHAKTYSGIAVMTGLPRMVHRRAAGYDLPGFP